MDNIEQAVRRLYASQEHRPSCEAVLRAIREARAVPDTRPGVIGFQGPRTDFVKTNAATAESLARMAKPTAPIGSPEWEYQQTVSHLEGSRARCTAHRSFNGCGLDAGHSGAHKSGGLTWEGPA